MTQTERRQTIERYGQAHAALVEGLRAFPREMWTFKPAPDQWSIHETVVHITDSEANSFVRCRRFIAEPGSTVMGYDENQWAKALRYHDQSTDDALELFRWLRRASYELIKSMPESVWANTVYHTESGTMTMDDWLDIYTRHIPEHLAQMQTVHAAWLTRK
jgi:hypothetical protein